MKTWMMAVAAALLITLAPAPETTAQNRGEQGENQGARTAAQVLGEIQVAARTLGRQPTDEQVTKYFDEAFEKAWGYVRENPEAADVSQIYAWATRFTSYGGSRDSFLSLAQAYLKANPNADDAMEWRKAWLIGGLDNDSHKSAVTRELATLKDEAAKDAAKALLYHEVQLLSAKNRNDEDGAKAAIEAIKKDSLILGSDDPWVYRDAMRVVLSSTSVELKVGEAFPCWSEAFPVRDLDGKEIKLADFKGKVVLIDFWAVWCGPCISSMPSVVKAYENYKDKGFEVLGVSFDRRNGEDELRATIRGEGRVGGRTGVMPWRQIYDGGFWGSGMAKRYGINSIPRMVLIGADGKVLETNIRSNALDARLKELLGE